VSDADQIGLNSADTIYTSLSLALTPGTWFVQAFATLSSTDNRDAKALGLYNETAAADVASSRSGISVANLGEPESFTTSKVIVVAVNTVIRMKAFRNGNSRVNFAPTAALGLLAGRQRMIALKLK
jgi:hypothetical protein